MKKTERQLRELASAFSGKISVPRNALLNDVVPLLFAEIVIRVSSQSDQKLEEAVGLLDCFGMTMDHFRENLMDLCANSKYAREYGELPSSAKASFTKLYNKTHDIEKASKKGGRRAAEPEVKDKVDPEFAEEMKPAEGEEDQDASGDDEAQAEDKSPENV